MTNQGTEQGLKQQQAALRQFNFNNEVEQTKSLDQKVGESAVNKNVNSNAKHDDIEDNDDESSSSDEDSDEYETETDEDDDDIAGNSENTNKNNERISSGYNLEDKENVRPTHNEFSHVGSKGIGLAKAEPVETRKEMRVTTHDFDKERKMLTFSDSEYNESENEETDLKCVGYDAQEFHSPTKVLTRKVAVRDDRKAGVDTRILLQKVTGNSVTNSDLLGDFDTSSFAPKAKSPLVISKEKVVTSKVPMPFRSDLKDDKFVYHSDSDSNGNKLKSSVSDDDESSDASESELKSKTKAFNERKTLQFDDDDEWDEKTPVVSRTRERQSYSGKDDHDRTLVEDSDKKNKHVPGKITLMCLNIGTPKNNKFSICTKWKIYYFKMSQN